MSRPRIPGFNYTYAYSGGVVTTAAWKEISASLPGHLAAVEIDDDSGCVLELGYGPAGSEVRVLLVPNGGTKAIVHCILNAGMRLVYRPVGQDTGPDGNFVFQGYI